MQEENAVIDKLHNIKEIKPSWYRETSLPEQAKKARAKTTRSYILVRDEMKSDKTLLNESQISMTGGQAKNAKGQTDHQPRTI